MRSAICAASQLPGREPVIWMLPLHINKKSDDDGEADFNSPSTEGST